MWPIEPQAPCQRAVARRTLVWRAHRAALVADATIRPAATATRPVAAAAPPQALLLSSCTTSAVQ